jgi:RNA polymerase sigma factor for flagellar operon FliA
MDIKEIWRRYQENQDHSAWEQLVEVYAPLVRHVAGRIRLILPAHVDYDDLVGSGTFGLLTAIDRFEPERGIKFETFATNRIRGAILDSLRAADWAPRSLRQREREMAQAYGAVERRMGRPAKAHEVASYMGIEVNELHDLERQINQVAFLSLDAPLLTAKDDDQGTLGSRLPDQQGDPLHALEEQEKRYLLAEAVRSLPEKEQLVVSLYYYDELNIKEIAQVLGVTDSRISQLHTRALLRLRGRLLNHASELELDERQKLAAKCATGQGG